MGKNWVYEDMDEAFSGDYVEYKRARPGDALAKMLGAKGNRLGDYCVTCGEEGNNSRKNFRDSLSWRERHISGMCQKCQDGVFGE